eukprot:TRINITY_DN7561_c0_g1_i1.p2 TRINITY_DN7561_c0_g1~~TRINITY_DN7561_c0_g1_i1.p2  ORF type:complete len:192 (+),score=22.63 TRINITY_DN7561_c0_g1_i1:433-1008(+)
MASHHFLFSAVKAGVAARLLPLKLSQADLEVRDDDGFTPLHLATFIGDGDKVRYFLSKGSNICARTPQNQTPLHMALRSHDFDVVIILLRYLQISDAQQIGDNELTAAILQEWSLLHYAVMRNNLHFIKLLHSFGADLDQCNAEGFTQLYYAVTRNNELSLSNFFTLCSPTSISTMLKTSPRFLRRHLQRS